MRIMIVSDTHGRHTNLDTALKREGSIDMLLHMGDIEHGEHDIEAIAQSPLHMVAGNNDYFSYLPKEKEIQIGPYKVWLTHGHNYFVSMDIRHLRDEARARKVDIVMFGHTHKPYIDLEGGVIVINPGSISYPRQEGRRATYIIMEIGADKRAHFELKYV